MIRKLREQNKNIFDDYHNIKNKEIEKNNLILFHDTQHEKDKNSFKKLNFK